MVRTIALLVVEAGLLALMLASLSGCAQPRDDISVLLLSADSLRIDRLQLWNSDGMGTPEAGPPSATPNLDRLAAGGTRFTNAWATSPWTAPSIVSVFTGLYPPVHGVVYRDDTTPPGLETLASVLAARDYEIGNFSFFSQLSYFRNLGLGLPVEGLKHSRVAKGFDDWLTAIPAERSFFAWVHLLETHLPYGASGYHSTTIDIEGSSGLEAAQLKGAVPVESVVFEEGDRHHLLDLYDRDVADLDRAIGQVLDAIERVGRTDSTIVVFVADHGEELLEYGWIGHASTSIEAKLVPEILRIPLILAGPGIESGRVREELVQQVDILPTIVDLLALPEPQNLGATLPGFEIFARSREHAYFDTSPGGNLTPADRRGERLQGVADKTCLHQARVGGADGQQESWIELADGGCDENARHTLRAALEKWRREQTKLRLEILTGGDAVDGPDSDQIDRLAETLEIVHPLAGGRLEWHQQSGQVALEWSGDGNKFWLEYQIGEGLQQVRGVFELEQRRVVFGPVPQGFWNDLAGYSPFRIRVADIENGARSAWIEFEIAPAG